MDKEEKVKYWLDLVDYDLDTAETLYNGGRWLYVAFMCHQLSRGLTPDYCRSIIDRTKEMQLWIKSKL